MNARTTLSAKGQVVIPKDVREALGFKPGQQLDVTRSGDAVVLRPAMTKSGATFDEVTARLRALTAYDGPVVTIEETNLTIEQDWREAAVANGSEEKADLARD